ncbi:MAG TPA: hypothetical protein VEU62_04460 [Bryobacterales bacterium]|nr:hypothetical protein [Bryobacterales bacterium]
MWCSLVGMALGLSSAVAAYPQQKPAPAKPPSEMERAVAEFQIETRNLGLRADSPPKKRNHRQGQAWHGRLFENFRNDFLDAVPHEITQRGGNKGLLRRNQFGFNVAGPVIIPRLLAGRGNTYFSLSYEGVRENIARTYLETIPTVPERTGDYSAVVDQAGNILPIYDPQTTRPNPAYDATQPVTQNNLQYLRDPFPGNRLPASRLDPVAQKAIGFYPQPNAAAGPFFRNNYFINSPETNTANGMIGKLEQTVKERHRVSTELAWSNGFLGAAHWFPTGANPGPTDRRFQTRRGSLEHVFTASSRTVNTATFEASSQASQSGDLADTTNYAAAIGLSGVGGQSFPLFQLSPYLSMGRSYPLSNNANNAYVFTDVLSTRRGKHTIRVTGQYTARQVNTFWPKDPAGMFRFGAGMTSLPGIINTGHPFASFLLGLPEYAERSIVLAPSYFRDSEQLLAFHDHYEARKGLVISLGLNMTRSTPRTEKYDRQSTIDLQAANPAGGLGALAAANRNGYGRAFQPNRLRLEPRLSIAWNPLGDAKTVVRAAFSRSYSAIPIYTGQWGTQGFSTYPTYISPNVQLQPAAVLADGLPAPATPIPDLRPDAANNTIADLMDATDRQPTYQSASLTVERELPASIVLTLGAAYSGGKNLLVGNYAANPNAIPLADLSFRDRLNDEQFNESLRPYPQYKGFDVYSSYPLGRYQRNAGFLRLEKRLSKGLALSSYFEWSKQMDDYSGPYGKQDFFNRQNEWSLTPYNAPERLQLSYVYELPVGADKPFLNFPNWRRYFVSGWSVSGMATISSGTPLYLQPQFNNTGGVVQALHVDVVPGVDQHVSNPGPSLWFNPAAFDQPADFSLGNASRTLPGLFNPGYQNYDLSLSKRIALTTDRTLEFSAAGFNFINHANWNPPDNVIGPASAPNVNAGKIIGSQGGRVIQLGLRFSF